MLGLLSYGYPSKLIFYVFALCQLSFALSQSEVIVCRTCGEDIGLFKFAHNLHNPLSKSVENQSEFDGSNEIFIRVLENYLGIRFELLTISRATCLERGSWRIEQSWFPGYAWRVCLCPRCHKQLGWFEPAERHKDPEVDDLDKPEGRFCGLHSSKLADGLIAGLKI